MTQYEIKISGQIEFYSKADLLPVEIDVEIGPMNVVCKLYFRQHNTTIEGINESIIDSTGISRRYTWSLSGSKLTNNKIDLDGEYTLKEYTPGQPYHRYFLKK